MPHPDEPDAPQDPPVPLGLDYFAANAPERRYSRAFIACWLALAAGCVPYLCGILNAMVVARSYSPEMTTAHEGGAAIFMGLGILLSAGALLGFIRLRHWTGIIAATLLLGMQVSVAACLAIGRAGSTS